MGMEIERRFLVTADSWRGQGQTRRLRQGFMCVEPERTVRVRVIGDQAWLTLKSKISFVSRYEFEYPVPLADAETMLDVMCALKIEKNRTRIERDGRVWEVDEFFGDNSGLVLAEIELPDEDTPFDRPDWLGAEVTRDPRYTNAHLAGHAYAGWSAEARARILD